MSCNFDVSIPDDDEFFLDDDYQNRDKYERSFSPPSPSLLKLDDESDETTDERITVEEKRPNPFLDDSHVSLDNDNCDKNVLLQKIQAFQFNASSPSEVIKVQELIIDYLKVSSYTCKFHLILF